MGWKTRRDNGHTECNGRVGHSRQWWNNVRWAVVAVALLASSLVLVGPGSTPLATALPTCAPNGDGSQLCLHEPTTDLTKWEQWLAAGAFSAPQVDDYNHFRLHRTTYTPPFRLPICPSSTSWTQDGSEQPPISEMPCSSPAFVRTMSDESMADRDVGIGGLVRTCISDCVIEYSTKPVIYAGTVITEAIWNEWSRTINQFGTEVTDWKRIHHESEVTLPAAAPTTPPVAIVDITPTGNPNEYKFSAGRSYATTPHALVSATHYEFSDGGTAGAQLSSDERIHQFTGPGPYSVKVTVEDSRRTTGTTERLVDDHLSVVGVLLGEASPAPDTTTTARVVVVNDGIGPVTGVAPTLTADPTDRVVVTGGPTPPTASLAVGESQQFTFDVKTGTAGDVMLTGAATGTGAKGPVAVTSKQIPYTIGAPELEVSLEVPERVGLKRDDAGEPIPVDVNVKVHLRNVGQSPLRSVTLRDGDPSQIPDEGVLALPFEPRTINPPPVRAIAEIAAGAEATLTIPFRAVRGGGVGWLARVDYTVDEGANQRTVTRTAEAHSEVGDTGSIAVRLTPQTTPVRAGDEWTLRGSIKNITNDATIDLEWVRTKMFGNAAGGWVVDVDNPPAIGASIPPSLEPGDTWRFTATIYTGVDFNALSAIELAPQGKITRNGTETALAPEDVAYDGPKRVAAEVITPTFDPSEQLTFGSVVGNFSYSTFSTIYEGLVGLRELPGLIGDVTSHALAVYGTQQRLDFLLTQYEMLPPEARDEWIDDTYKSLEAQYGKESEVLDGLKAQIASWFSDVRFAIDSGDVNQLARIGGSATANLFDTEIFAVFSKVVRPKWSRFLVTKAEGFEDAARATAITDSSLALARMEAAPTAAAAEIAADDLRKSLVSGTPVTAESAKMWGVSTETHEFLAQLAKQRGYLISLRARGIGAIEKLQQGFIPKMELIKLKNVDPIDVEFLGYLQDDLNTVVLKQPPVANVDGVQAWVNANVADPAARVGVAERLTTRVEEWAKVQKRAPGYEYLTYVDQGYIPVPFNVAENLAMPFSQAWNKRVVSFLKGLQNRLAGKATFELAAVDGQAGYFRLKVNGRGVTGDIDFMDFRKANGEQLTDVERVGLYRDLADGSRKGIVQLQHPETITWFMDGAQWFKAKKKYIEEFAGPGSDTLLQYSPEAGGSARAVRYDPARSMIEQRGAGNIWHYEGGFTTPERFRIGVSDLSFIGSLAAQIRRTFEGIWGPPTTWLVDPGQPGTTGDTNGGGGGRTPKGRIGGLTFGGLTAAQMTAAATRILAQPLVDAQAEADDTRVPVAYRFSTKAGAVVARAGWNHLESWSAAAGWTPMADADIPVLDLMPQTSLDGAASAGSAGVVLLAPSAATVGTESPAEWFSPGQKVVINPGESNEEIRTIATTSPLTFTEPLALDHLSGEMVSVIAAAPVSPPTTTPATDSTTTTVLTTGSTTPGTTGPSVKSAAATANRASGKPGTVRDAKGTTDSNGVTNGATNKLARTGQDNGNQLRWGLVLLCVGLLLVGLSRRRSSVRRAGVRN